MLNLRRNFIIYLEIGCYKFHEHVRAVRFTCNIYSIQSIWTFAIWIKFEKDLGSSTFLQSLFWISVIGATIWFFKFWYLLWDDVLLKIKTEERRVRDQDWYIKPWLPIKPCCLWFVTTISNLWNMLLNCREVRWSGRGLDPGVGPLQNCVNVCMNV